MSSTLSSSSTPPPTKKGRGRRAVLRAKDSGRPCPELRRRTFAKGTLANGNFTALCIEEYMNTRRGLWRKSANNVMPTLDTDRMSVEEDEALRVQALAMREQEEEAERDKKKGEEVERVKKKEAQKEMQVDKKEKKKEKKKRKKENKAKRKEAAKEKEREDDKVLNAPPVAKRRRASVSIVEEDEDE
jgi:hypothetical protein